MATRSIADELRDYLGEGTPSKIPDAIIEEALKVIEVPKLEATEWMTRADGKQMRLVPFSEKFWKPNDVPDHLVAEFVGYDSAEPKALYIPPKEDFEWVSFCLSNNIKPLSVGPTGCGKTLIYEHFAAVCGRPCLRIDNSQELDKAQVFGTVHITDGDTDFVPGDIPLSATAPTVVILDEFSRAPSGANMIYKRLLDRNEIYMPEMKEAGKKAIKPDEYWVVCGTDNTKGDGEDMDKYPSSNVQDAALRNVWGMLIEADYLDKASEAKMIETFSPDMDKKSATALALFSSLIHAGFKRGEVNTAFSPRQLETICDCYNKGVPLKQAIQKAYINFCSKSELSDVTESLRAAFGS
jgi:hypothetical protein